jgi:hypothetical protein
MEAVCIRVKGERGRSSSAFLHSEYKHVLLLSIHWVSGARCMERNVQGCDEGLAKKTVSDWYA